LPPFIQQLIDQVHPSVSESTVLKLEAVLRQHLSVFSTSETDLGLTNLTSHHIDTGDAKPFRQPLRRFPPAHVVAIEEHVNNMLAQGVIEPACSPWASNIVLVRKKDGSFRCCIDYRQLNSATRKDAYPLPRIDTCLDAMASAQWFSTFDLRSSYHQVMVNPPDSDKTAFICPRGMYRFRTMPFGLCNAGATFQRLMDVVMSGLNLHICLVYLDDIIVYSRTAEEHLERLTEVLDRLTSAGLKLKPEKCALFQKSVSFLGHMITAEGIATDPDKIKAVMDWPEPTCLRDIRAFLGLASYYRRFVKDFATIAAPLNGLIKKGSVFGWSTEAQDSFNTLKTALTSPPILAMPTDDGDFTLDTDASDYAIGAVLSQKQDGVERVVAYASRSLDRRERNYCVTRKELLAVVHFLRHFKQYLLGRHFKVRTDHAALTWLRRTPEPIGQQARWAEQLEEYDFVVEHRPGKQHGNADALSRRPCPKRDCMCHEHRQPEQRECIPMDVQVDAPADKPTCPSGGIRMVVKAEVHRADELSEAEEVDIETVGTRQAAFGGPADSVLCAATHREIADDRAQEEQQVSPEPQFGNPDLPWSLEGLVRAQEADPDVGHVISMLKQNAEKPAWDSVSVKSSDVKTLWGMWPRLAVRNGLLKRKFEAADGSSERWQVVWPKELRQEFLRIAHSGMTGGHMSKRRTAAAVQSRAYWPTWSSDLQLFIRRCEPCARYHRGTVRPQVALQSPLVGEPWERVSVDITGPHPRSSRQNQYILTLVDHFSKWAEAIPLRNHTAPTVARALMVHVFSRFGAPRQLLTDRGPEFESELFQQLMTWMEIDKLRTTAYKPSTNGVVERFHRTLNSMLGKIITDGQRDWDEKLPLVLAAYRASSHSSTGFSPNRLFLGRETRMPLDLVMGLPADECNKDRSFTEFIIKAQEDAEVAYGVAREHLRVAAERRKANYDIRVKPLEFAVGDWVWYWYPRRFQRKSPKWQKNYTGPYLIVRVIRPSNYVLQKSPRSKPFVVHADKLKRCYSSTPDNWLAAGVVTNNDSPAPETTTPELNNNGGDNSASDDVPDSSHSRMQNETCHVNDFVCDIGVVDDSRVPKRSRKEPLRLRDYVC
jgi:transposase InsO family protein